MDESQKVKQLYNILTCWKYLAITFTKASGKRSWTVGRYLHMGMENIMLFIDSRHETNIFTDMTILISNTHTNLTQNLSTHTLITFSLISLTTQEYIEEEEFFHSLHWFHNNVHGVAFYIGKTTWIKL